MKFSYRLGEQELMVTLEKHGDGYRARVGERDYEVVLLGVENGRVRFTLDGATVVAFAAQDGPGTRWVSFDGQAFKLEKVGPAGRRRSGESGAGDGQVLAPMPGQVREVFVAEGEAVEHGQTLLIMEAMKMEIRIQAPAAGVVQGLTLKVGDSVNKDDVLLKIGSSAT